MSGKSRRLPNGSFTTSSVKYLKEWDKVCKEAEGYFPGYETIGYDPGILLCKGFGDYKTNTETFTLTLSMLEALHKAWSNK